jgi:predicted ester cyclase
MYIAAFPDLHFAVDEILPSGNTGVGRVTITGTNTGDFLGMPATGRSVAVQAIDIIRWGDDGLAHEHWGVVDVMGMMQQLGVVPMP